MLEEKERLLGEVATVVPKESNEIDDLLDFSPYLDDPEEHATENGKELPPLPRDEEELNTLSSRRNVVYKVIVSIVTVILSLLIIFVVLTTTGFFRELKLEREQIHNSKTPQPSRDFALNFPEQYPPLDSKRSSAECRAAWQTLTEIPCHDAIWTRNWDSGVPQLLGPSLDRFVPLICDARCAPALEEAKDTIRSACSKADAFDVGSYKGRFSTDLLEPGPTDVLDVLVERQTRMCRTSPTGDAERDFCMTDLNSRWGIVDGIRSNGTQGLAWFLTATNSRSVQPAGWHTGRQGSGGWSETYRYWREERKFGPGRGETTCSWCTLDWLKGKLQLWEQGMRDLDGNDLSLPEYLRMWENAGKRCAGDEFLEAYHTAIEGYIAKGLFQADWESQPSGDIPYLMRHGPTAGDFPAKDVDQMVEKMKVFQNRTVNINPTNPARIKLQAAVVEYIDCLQTFKEAVQDLSCYPFLSKDQISEYVLTDIDTAQQSCSACGDSLNLFKRKVFTACPSVFSGREYSEKLKFADKEASTFVEKFFQSDGTISNFEATCRVADTWPRRGPPCSAIFAQWGKQDWIYQDPRLDLPDLITTTRRLLSELPEMPQHLKEWKSSGNQLTAEEKQIIEELTAWRNSMARGVCSDCLSRRYVEWNGWFIGNIPRGTPEGLAIEWIQTVHQLQDQCATRGRVFSESELISVDERWKAMYSDGAWTEAFKESEQQPALISEYEELV